MSSRQAIKKRIKSVSNTKQITKAMELVAASKLRKAQEDSLAPKKYIEQVNNLIASVYSGQESINSIFFNTNDSDTILTIVISSDKGLAGAYNNNVLKEMFSHFNKNPNKKHKVISIGRYASLFLAKINNLNNEKSSVNEVSAYLLGSDNYNARLVLPISRELKDLFISSSISEVYVVYTDFESTIKQQVKTTRLIPFVANKGEVFNTDKKTIEPNKDSVINNLINMYIEANLTNYIFDSVASEHSSRMLAMKNATDNASDLIEDLTLIFNNARQAAITQELAEISAGAQAIN